MNGFGMRLVRRELVTPVIHYQAGIAVSISRSIIGNRGVIFRHSFSINPNGTYSEYFRVNGPKCQESFEEPVTRESLEEFDRNNSFGMPLISILGNSKENVELVLREKGILASHF